MMCKHKTLISYKFARVSLKLAHQLVRSCRSHLTMLNLIKALQWMLLLLVIIVCQLHSGTAYYSYRQRIPNGERVPNPCESGKIWEGVGHQNPAGAGQRNPFGRDFAAAGFQWTESLCRKDSDGDGVSNGEELGDPACVWRVGATPARTSGITHPGLCPLGSTTCQNSWPVCPKKFECPALEESHVFTRNYTIQETVVPPNETVYMCQAFELNSTADPVHMIGSRPIVRNKNVLHHMIIYGCNKKPSDSLFNSPQSCFMGNADCPELLNIWAYGFDGECFNQQAGIMVGGLGYRYGLLELHWNNPEKVNNYKDSSGFTIYYTKNLRKYNQGVSIYGELRLNLPPKQPIISYNHTCPGQCTRAFHNGTRYITWASFHMHQYGVKGRVSLMRNGSLVKELVPFHNYDYNTPPSHIFNPPIEYQPGDEVKTECYFSTKSATKSVFWGFDTQQEMCFSYFHYFPNEVEKPPNQKLSNCYGYGGMNTCAFRLPGSHIEAGCNVTALRSGEASSKALELMTANQCFSDGCRESCRKFLNETMWPSSACFDPKRSKRMAEVLSTTYWIPSPTNPAIKGQISINTSLVLHAQAACERELEILEQATKMEQVTKTKTVPPMPKLQPPTITSEHLTIIIIVCSCLVFVLLIAALGLVGMRMRAVGGHGSGNSYVVEKAKCEF